MTRLPVIVGLGGVNSAGRISSDHAYRRLVIDRLATDKQASTFQSLAALMNLEGDPADASVRRFILDHTLVRRIESTLMDVDALPQHRRARIGPDAGGSLRFSIPKKNLPSPLPPTWRVIDDGAGQATVEVNETIDILLPESRVSRVTSGGQVPTGFDPGALYQSRSHPRGLQLTVFGASDALNSLGIDWDQLKHRVGPDDIAVYGGSAMSQMDQNGNGGLLQSHLVGKRVTSKQVALGLPEMVADFVNAYVVGSVGGTGCNIGACATFLYNLGLAIEDIRSGRRRVVIVGNSEAPITPEIIEGYRTMGALAEDAELMKLDNSDYVDNRRACRPFSSNSGFTLAEASVFTVLCDDELALELGASIHGTAAGVFVNADGYKKSIPGPGVGNYLTVAKALACVRAMLGQSALQRTHVQAHGTGTPQNRVTESHILSAMARNFGIDDWLVCAVKSYLGHSLAPAGGDQLAVILGMWRDGIAPGIKTIDHIADDVHQAHLRFEFDHVDIGAQAHDAGLINSKGFGGNNATGVVISPHVTMDMLARKHGAAALAAYQRRHDGVAASQREYDEKASHGSISTIYRFGENVIDGDDITFDGNSVMVPGYSQPLSLRVDNPYPDYFDK